MRHWRLLLVAPLLLLLAGCRLDAVVTVDVARDGGGTFAVELTIDEELHERASAAGVDPFGGLRDDLAGVAGWSVSERGLRGGGRQLRLSSDFAEPEAFNALASAFTDALRAPELDGLGPLTLEKQDGTIHLRGNASLATAEGTPPFGDAVTYELRVQLPGEVLDTNADRVDQGLLIWQVPADGTVSLVADGTLPRGRTWMLVVGGLLAGLVSALVLKRPSAQSVE